VETLLLSVTDVHGGTLGVVLVVDAAAAANTALCRAATMDMSDPYIAS